MNINEAIGLQKLTTPSEDELQLNRHQVLVFIDPSLASHVVSKKFHRAMIPTNKLAYPFKAMKASRGPVVVDLNSRELGKLQNGFKPKVVVLSGQAFFLKAHADRTPKIEAWVGELAAKALGLVIMSEDELRGKLEAALETMEPFKSTIVTRPSYENPERIETKPNVISIFPIEGFFISQVKGQNFRHDFTVEGSKVKVGPPRRTEIAAARSSQRPQTAMEIAIAINAHCKVSMAGKAYDILALNEEFKAACKNGYMPKMKAVSPPGWSGVTKKMKEDHPDKIDNPYALAWWMEEQGYEPHVPEEK